MVRYLDWATRPDFELALRIDALEPYMLIEKELKAQKEIYDALEREKMPILQRRNEAFATSSPSWLGGKESDLHTRIQSPVSYR